jgi:hypothetical protein
MRDPGYDAFHTRRATGRPRRLLSATERWIDAKQVPASHLTLISVLKKGSKMNVEFLRMGIVYAHHRLLCGHHWCCSVTWSWSNALYR